MELSPGEQLGAYRLIERAGIGGMAEVWRAYQPSLERYVAIKVLPRHLAAARGYVDRFRREARVISRLEHPNILSVFDFGEQDGFTYMVTPFIAGDTLAQRLGRPWPVAEVLIVLEPLASALDYAHGQGVVHRDVKPSNVLLSRQSRVVLGDFGVAHILEATTELTQAGTVLGTPAYMAPEQVLGEAVGPSSDLYALGIVVYEMLTGSVPYAAETPLAVALAQVHQPLPPPRTRNPALSAAVEGVLLKALAKDPRDRYPDGAALSRGLAAAAQADQMERPVKSTDPLPHVRRRPAERPPPDDGERSRPPRKSTRWRWPVALAGGLVAAALAIFGPLSNRTPSGGVLTLEPPLVAGPNPFTPPNVAPPPITSTAAASTAASTQALGADPPTVAPTPTAVVVWRAFGSKGTDPGEFDAPAGAAVDGQGNVYVADSANNRIQKLSPSGEPVAQWGMFGLDPGQFVLPQGVAVDGQDNVYVVDASDRIQKLSATGQPLAQWGAKGTGPGQFDHPWSVAVDGQGNLFVADAYNNRIQKLSSTGQPLAQWGAQGTAPGEFDRPNGVAVDGQGNVFVSDAKNNRIQKLSPMGQPLAQWGTQGSGAGQLSYPTGVALDGQGNLYVLDAGNGRVQKLSPTGQPLAQWGAWGSDVGQFESADGLAVDGQGNIFVIDTLNNRVEKLSPTGR